MHARTDGPVGIFDSGVGGWTVLREIRRELPGESLIYVADSAHAPYGELPVAAIVERAHAIAAFLVGQGAKALVIACNTATAAAVTSLRARWALPIVAMEPAVKPAAALTRSGVVGVLTTRLTAASERLSQLRDTHGRNVRILTCAATGLVECIEAGEFEGPRVDGLLERYVRPLCEEGADVLVLGCTHFPLLSAPIQRCAGPGCRLIDPAPAVARELGRRLGLADLLHPGSGAAPRVLTTGQAVQFERLLDCIGAPGTAVTSIDIEACAPALR